MGWVNLERVMEKPLAEKELFEIAGGVLEDAGGPNEDAWVQGVVLSNALSCWLELNPEWGPRHPLSRAVRKLWEDGLLACTDAGLVEAGDQVLRVHMRRLRETMPGDS